MNNDMTIRDPYAMESFAKEVDDYITSMNIVCNKLKSDLSSAKPYMKDRVSSKAIINVENFVDNILKTLPIASDASDKLKRSAKVLKRAKTL